MSAFDVLKKALPMIEESSWEQANEETSHSFLKTTSKPTGKLVGFNQGAPYEKAVNRGGKEFLARIESNMRVDTRILEASKFPGQFMREQEMRFFEGLINTYHETIFSKNGRGSAKNVQDISGLGERYGKLNPDTVVSLGAAGGHSIWLIKHGLEGLSMLYPASAGKTIQINHYGAETVYDDDGNPFRAETVNFAMAFGMMIAQDNAVQRICNIAASGNNSFFEDGTNVNKGTRALIDAIERLPQGSTDQVAIYVGREMMGQIRKRLDEKANMYFTKETVWGRPMITFMDIPILRVDTLNGAEPQVN
jgi:hypothetical protein